MRWCSEISEYPIKSRSFRGVQSSLTCSLKKHRDALARQEIITDSTVTVVYKHLKYLIASFEDTADCVLELKKVRKHGVQYFLNTAKYDQYGVIKTILEDIKQ
jgi:hypothetical protein